jgi:hypothetical protein
VHAHTREELVNSQIFPVLLTLPKDHIANPFYVAFPLRDCILSVGQGVLKLSKPVEQISFMIGFEVLLALSGPERRNPMNTGRTHNEERR